MSLRVAFDMDGVLADFAAAYRDVEMRLFGPRVFETADRREEEADPIARSNSSVRRNRRRKQRRAEATWNVIRTTRDFWVSLKPVEPASVHRLYSLMVEHRWEVFFVTQRPATRGDTVQRQTQRWLHEQGFDMPSVLVLNGSRSGVAASLSLDYYVDDDAANCVDLTSESHARSILIAADAAAATLASARRLGIATARNIEGALDILDEASVARLQPRVLQKLAHLVGWR